MAKAIKLCFLVSYQRNCFVSEEKYSNPQEREDWGVFWFGLAPTRHPTAAARPRAALPVDKHIEKLM